MAKKDTSFGHISSNSEKKEKAIAAINTVFKDMNSVYTIVRSANFNTSLYDKTEQVFKNVSSIVSQTNNQALNLKKIQLMTKSIIELSYVLIKAKESNPLISDELIDLITQTSHDANTALKLTKEVFNS